MSDSVHRMLMNAIPMAFVIRTLTSVARIMEETAGRIQIVFPLVMTLMTNIIDTEENTKKVLIFF